MPLFGPSAKLLLSAGGRGDPDTFRRLNKEGIQTIEFYGSSEASIIACTPAGDWRDGYAGKLVPDVETKLSRQGELLVKSPGLMLGYYGDSEMSHLVFDEDGFYRTGDLVRIEDTGTVQVFGRRRDVFGTPEGSNIYPERLENLLESQEWVEQAFLVGDGLSFLTAHLVVQPKLLKRKERTREDLDVADPQSVRHGFISPQDDPELYLQVGEILDKINRGLELIEKVVAFALYSTRFPEECYRMVTGKVQRTRTRFVEMYGGISQMLYSELDKSSPMLVPPRERRFSIRTGQHIQSIADPLASVVDSEVPEMLRHLQLGTRKR
jgi:long-subunit acyl-CoA synthetase (AMP-forming)